MLPFFISVGSENTKTRDEVLPVFGILGIVFPYVAC